MTFSEEKLLKELRAAKADQESVGDEPWTITTPEYEEKFDVSYRRARRDLKALNKQGILEAKMIARVDEWSRVHPVAGYKLPQSRIDELAELDRDGDVGNLTGGA